jgi:hypothetical protein
VPAHDTRVLASALSPDGSTVGTAASDENLKVRAAHVTLRLRDSPLTTHLPFVVSSSGKFGTPGPSARVRVVDRTRSTRWSAARRASRARLAASRSASSCCHGCKALLSPQLARLPNPSLFLMPLHDRAARVALRTYGVRTSWTCHIRLGRRGEERQKSEVCKEYSGQDAPGR